MIVVNARFLTQKITGVQRFASEISKQLKLNVKDIYFVCPKGVIQDDLEKKLNVKVIGKHQGYLWEQYDLPIYLRKIGSPLLLCFCNTGPLFYQNKIITLHDITFIRYPQSYSKTFLFFYKVFIPFLLKFSKEVFTVSEFSKKEIQHYYRVNPNKIKIAYNAVSTFFSPVVNHKDKYFLCVSSVKKNKNFELVLNAFLFLSKFARMKYRLIVVGDINNHTFSSIDISSFSKYKNIQFVGRVSDEKLRDYYRLAKAFIFPSLYEGFGIPPLEAQACGCPVIASDIPVMKEILNNSAMFFNPYSSENLIDCIEKIVDSKKIEVELIQRGFLNVKRFSWLRSSLEYKKIIDEFDF